MDIETSVDTKYLEGIPVIDVDGDLDHRSTTLFREQVVALAERGCASVIIDMADVTFMDSGGMSAIIFALKRLPDENGRVVLAGSSAHIVRKLEIGGLTKLSDKLTLAPSVERAVQELK